MSKRDKALLAYCVLFLAAVLFQACSTEHASLDDAVDLQAMLPALPQDDSSTKEFSAADPEVKNGVDNWDNSGNVTVEGSSLTVNSAGNRLDWAMYRFTVGETSTVQSLDIAMASVGGSAWAAVSDYGNSIWRLEGPTLVWHFRGAPHVHAYVNIGAKVS